MTMDRKEIEDFLTDEQFKEWVLNPSQESEKYWTDYLQKNKENEKTFQEAKAIILAIRFTKYNSDAETKSRIYELIKQHGTDESAIGLHIPLWLKLAVAVVVTLGIGFFVTTNNVGNQTFVAKTIKYENPAGVRSRLQLPDCTVVYLSYKSRIDFPEKFTMAYREVSVSGEAYFEVTENKQKPFIVSTEFMRVEVLGTHFNVKARPSENAVALTKGSVKVFNPNNADSLMLVPGEMATYNVDDNSMNVSGFDNHYDLGWKDDKLVFRDASLDDVVERLSGWYGVEFKILNKSKSPAWSYSGTFHNESLTNVLLSLSTVRHFQYKITKKQAIITFPTD